MIRMLIGGYCYGIRFERRLCEEVKLHLGYRWFCRLELEDKVPDHSTFSVNRHGRFRDSERAWMQVSSRARASQLMRASWKPMPVVIMAMLPERSIGRRPNARR